MKKTFKHFNLEQRLKIKQLLDAGNSMRAISRELGFSPSAVHAEISRNSQHGEYDPYVADTFAKEKQKQNNRHAILAIDPALAEKIAELILVEEMSVPNIVAALKEMSEFKSTPKSRNTIYRAIDQGLIPGVTRESQRMILAKAKMTSDNAIYIPKWACQKYGFQAGDEFDFSFSKNGIITLIKRNK